MSTTVNTTTNSQMESGVGSNPATGTQKAYLPASQMKSQDVVELNKSNSNPPPNAQKDNRNKLLLAAGAVATLGAVLLIKKDGETLFSKLFKSGTKDRVIEDVPPVNHPPDETLVDHVDPADIAGSQQLEDLLGSMGGRGGFHPIQRFRVWRANRDLQPEQRISRHIIARTNNTVARMDFQAASQRYLEVMANSERIAADLARARAANASHPSAANAAKLNQAEHDYHNQMALLRDTMTEAHFYGQNFRDTAREARLYPLISVL